MACRKSNESQAQAVADDSLNLDCAEKHTQGIYGRAERACRQQNSARHLTAALVAFQQLGNRNAALKKGFGLLKRCCQKVPVSITACQVSCLCLEACWLGAISPSFRRLTSLNNESTVYAWLHNMSTDLSVDPPRALASKTGAPKSQHPRGHGAARFAMHAAVHDHISIQDGRVMLWLRLYHM